MNDLFLHLHSALANILLPLCLVRGQSNRYHQSHNCAKRQSGGYSDLGDTKRCVCISCLCVAQMRLLKPCTDVAHVAQDCNTALCTCHISTVRLQTAVVLTQFRATSFHQSLSNLPFILTPLQSIFLLATASPPPPTKVCALSYFFPAAHSAHLETSHVIILIPGGLNTGYHHDPHCVIS